MVEHKHAEMLRALADGNEIEYIDSYGEWKELAALTPNDVKGWRIKPELISVVYSKSDYEAYKSNVRLIAATPDLLAALRLFLAHVPKPECAIWENIRNNAVSAIARATMETQTRLNQEI